MSEPRALLLTDRLRGRYVLAINDGAGPLDGKMTFERQFDTPPIQHEAADLIEELTGVLLAMFVEGPVRVALAGNPIACDALEARARAAIARALGEPTDLVGEPA